MLVSRIYSGGSKMTPSSKMAKNDHISIKFCTHIKNGNLSGENEKNGQNRSKMAKIGPKMGIFIDFLTFFQNLITFRIFFSQTSLTPEMKDLNSLFHIKLTPMAHLQPFFQYSALKTVNLKKSQKIAKNLILAKNGEKFEFA